MKKRTSPRDSRRAPRELSRAELPAVVGGTDMRQAQSTQVQPNPEEPTLP